MQTFSETRNSKCKTELCYPFGNESCVSYLEKLQSDFRGSRYVEFFNGRPRCVLYNFPIRFSRGCLTEPVRLFRKFHGASMEFLNGNMILCSSKPFMDLLENNHFKSSDLDARGCTPCLAVCYFPTFIHRSGDCFSLAHDI